MSWQAWLTLAVVAVMVFTMVRDLLAPAVAVVGAVVVLLVTGVIGPQDAFGGFSNAAPLTVAALFVLAAAVERTGTLQPLMEMILGRARGRVALGRLLFPTAGVSAFLNNTPIVAMLAPEVSAWAERRDQSPSRFLMPLSFATILGGVVTLIGTSTNLLVSGLLEAGGREPIGMFELTRVGAPVAVAGLVYLVLFTDLLLPERRAAARQAQEELRAFTVHMEVSTNGPLDGATVEAGGLRHLQGVFLVQVQRGREVIAPVTPNTQLQGGDVLTFAGKVDLVIDLQRTRGLVSAEREHIISFNSPGRTFFEAVLGESSPLIGKTLKEAEFRGRYQAAVVAIHRAGQRVPAKLGAVHLKVGDTLLILADPGFRDRWRDRPDFLLVSRVGGSPPMATRRAAIVGAITMAVVLLAGAGILPILQASMLGALAIVATGVLTPAEARAAVDLDVILVIAGSFGLGAAIERSGLAAVLASGIASAGGRFGMVGAIGAVSLGTVVLTEFITNNAAAALMFPIGIAVALNMHGDPRAFAIAVAVSASASFLTPIGYQTNTMVYGMGGYRFADFTRLGVGLTAIVLVAVTTTIGWFGWY
ncbi:MAG TPA: SLC13 family permease [Gemmatimonadaceae bacterium]|nr:SLC13 family permease [Gemmatimonadaceae bacterium]